MIIKLAIHGKANTGKDSLAKIFERIAKEEFNISCYITAFANPLKNMLCNYIFDNSKEIKEILFGNSENRKKIIPGTNKTYRDLLVESSKVFTNIYPNIWIDKTLQHLQEIIYDQLNYHDDDFNCTKCSELKQEHSKHVQNQNMFLISDLRFKREFDALKQEHFKLIKLTRPNNDYSLNIESETELDEIPEYFFDYHVVNNGPILLMEDKVREIITSELKFSN